MKRFITFMTVALVVCLMAFSANAQSKQKPQKNTEEVTFVTSLDCKNCVKKIEANLPFEKGIKDMKVTLENKQVWIKYDTRKTDVESLKKAINKLGYSAEVIKEEAK